MADNERSEFVPGGRAIWQSDTAASFQCPGCHGWVRTQDETGEPAARIECHGFMNGHTVYWRASTAQR
jgi:hypothetical protein